MKSSCRGQPAQTCLPACRRHTLQQPQSNRLRSDPISAKFPYISYIDQLSNQDTSHYNALQASLTQRTSHGLSFTAAYTYSHALDDVSQNFGSSVPLNNLSPV